MANARGKEIDNTHLSIDQANERGFIHRDYIAHCLRWTHVAKYLNLKARYKTANIIDVGCGKDMPLARMLMTMRMAPMHYLGIEYNKMEVPEMFKNTKFKPNLISGKDFCTITGGESLYNYSTCFEVLEHVEPLKAIEILQHLPKFLTEDSVLTRKFWAFAKAKSITTFGGVPYTFEILKKINFEKIKLPSLKYVTQAGGKLVVNLLNYFYKIVVRLQAFWRLPSLSIQLYYLHINYVL